MWGKHGWNQVWCLRTREALFVSNEFLQKCWDHCKAVFVCFVDYEKSFERVKHRKLSNILVRKDVIFIISPVDKHTLELCCRFKEK